MTQPAPDDHSKLFDPDLSLQAVGKRLRDYGTAAADLHTTSTRATNATAGYSEALTKLARHVDSEQPMDRQLASDIDSAATRMKEIARQREELDAKEKQIVAEAEGWRGTYLVAHEVDQTRVDDPRGGSVAVESRADVSRAAADS
jgi:hypothetical protein